MKILIFSDSHGNTYAVEKALAKEPDANALIFLGDGVTDLSAAAALSGIAVHAVRGNCDYDHAYPADILVYFQNYLLFCTHGNGYEVKNSLVPLKKAAREKQADIVLFGHTHLPCYEYDNGLYLFNPGSLSGSRTQIATYGVMSIGESKPYFAHKEIQL